MKLFCVAPTFCDGVAGHFCDGPTPEFDPHWMRSSQIVFESDGLAPPRLAVAALLARADSMSQEMYCALQTQAEHMDRDAAQGRDASDRFDQDRQDLHAVLDAAPWQMHPDHGCIRSTEVEEHDRAAPTPKG